MGDKRRLSDIAAEAEASLREELKQARKYGAYLEDRISRILGSQYRLDLPKRRKPKAPPAGSFTRVVLSDLHGQHMDKRAFAAALDAIQEMQPRHIVILGDWVDCGGWLSEHPTLHERELTGAFEDDIAAGNQTLDEIQRAAPKAAIEYLEGNHEWRIAKTIIRLTKGSKKDTAYILGMIGIRALLNLRARGIAYYRHDETYDGLGIAGAIRRDGVLYTHGPFRSCGMNATRANLLRLKAEFRQGHVHRRAVTTSQNADGEILSGICFGCLCDLRPKYVENNVTDWAHGIGVERIRKSGRISTWPIAIDRGVSDFDDLRSLAA